MEEFLVTLFLLALFTGVSSVTTISTVPADTTLATGFNNLIVTAQFPTPTVFGDSCVWLYGGELDSGSGVSFYSQLSGCGAPAPGTFDSITCTEQTIDSTSHVVTTLTITQPLVAGNLNIEVTCTSATTPGSITRTVQDCSLDEATYPNLAFTCNDAPCAYNSAGTLSCIEGFSSSGGSTSSTTCQADATLTNLDVLTCAAITCNGSDAENRTNGVCLVNTTPTPTTFQYGDTVSVQCCSNDSVTVDITCDGNSTSGWSSISLGCTPVTCTGADVLIFDITCLVNEPDANKEFSYGDTTQVKCCSGGGGFATKTCDISSSSASGMWDLPDLPSNVRTLNGGDYAIIVIFSVLTVLSFSVVPLYQFYDWQFLGNKWVQTGAVIVATGSGLGLIIGYTSVSQSICNCVNGNVSIALSEGGAIAIGVCLSLLVVVVAGVEFYFVFSKANKPKLGGNVTEHDASLHAEHEGKRNIEMKNSSLNSPPNVPTRSKVKPQLTPMPRKFSSQQDTPRPLPPITSSSKAKRP